jgi:hypothetical protein
MAEIHKLMMTLMVRLIVVRKHLLVLCRRERPVGAVERPPQQRDFMTTKMMLIPLPHPSVLRGPRIPEQLLEQQLQSNQRGGRLHH